MSANFADSQLGFISTNTNLPIFLGHLLNHSVFQPTEFLHLEFHLVIQEPILPEKQNRTHGCNDNRSRKNLDIFKGALTHNTEADDEHICLRINYGAPSGKNINQKYIFF